MTTNVGPQAPQPDEGRPNQSGTGVESPVALAPDRRIAAWRDIPSRTDAMAVDVASAIGGPVGRHAVIGRQRYLTPVRIVLFVALLFLALGW